MKTNQTHGDTNWNHLSRFAFLKTILILFLCVSFHYESEACSGGTDTIFIEHDTTWTSTTIPTAFHGQNILIKDGYTLTLRAVTLYFWTNSGIMNRTNPTTAAHLVIESSYLNGCPAAYNAPWIGIRMTGVHDIHGYSEYSVSGSTISGNPLQSSVKIVTSFIHAAADGILIINHAIVQIIGTSFSNCRTGVSIRDIFPDYNFANLIAHTGTGVDTSESYITNSQFTVQDTVNGLYYNLTQDTCVYLYGTQYFQIMGTSFKCSHSGTGYNTRPIGIFAHDANFSCHSTTGAENPETGCISYTAGIKVSNTFIGLEYGIYAETDTVEYSIHLDDNQFIQCFTALYVLGGMHHVIHANYFRFTDSSAYWSSTTGVRNNLVDLENAYNFVFYGNKLAENRETNTAFLYINNSGSGQKNITSDSFINEYSGSYASGDSEFALYFHGLNTDQFVTCNYFQKHNYSIYCDASSKLSKFGNSSDSGVGNVFTPSSPVPNSFYTNPPYIGSSNTNWWVYNANTSYTLWYYTHDPTTPGIIYEHTNLSYINGSSPPTNTCNTISSCKSWPLAIEQFLYPNLEVKLYPNPASGMLIFDFSGIAHNKEAKIGIYDIEGRCMGIFKIADGTSELTVNTAKYADGIYIYRMVLNSDAEKTGKFEIRH